MSSKPDRATKANDAIRSFTSKTEDFIGDILRDASARGSLSRPALSSRTKMARRPTRCSRRLSTTRRATPDGFNNPCRCWPEPVVDRGL